MAILNYNKKGSMLDIPLIIVLLFVIATTILVARVMTGELNMHIQAADDIDVQGKAIMQNNNNGFVALWDGIFLFLLVSLFITTIIAALFVDAHPVFFAISILLLVIFLIIAAVLANVYGEMETASGLSTYAAEFTYIPWVMQYFVQIILFMACSVILAMYGKTRAGA